MNIDQPTIDTLRSLAEQCAAADQQAGVDPATLAALLDRLEIAEAKLAAIGKLCPTHFDDREQLLGALFRILRGQMPEPEEEEQPA